MALSALTLLVLHKVHTVHIVVSILKRHGYLYHSTLCFIRSIKSSTKSQLDKLSTVAVASSTGIIFPVPPPGDDHWHSAVLTSRSCSLPWALLWTSSRRG
ncbi:hypothetical protein BDW69DRAFT_158109 [Aspergillus filifer]